MKTPARIALLEALEQQALALHKDIGLLMTDYAELFDWKVIEILDAASFKALEIQRHLKKAYEKTYKDK